MRRPPSGRGQATERGSESRSASSLPGASCSSGPQEIAALEQSVGNFTILHGNSVPKAR